MKFTEYEQLPRGLSTGRCDQCGLMTGVMYDIQTDKVFCSPECRFDYERAAVRHPREITEPKLS